MASGRSDLRRSCVILGEPLHRVDRRLMTVDIPGLVLLSVVIPTLPGVLVTDALWPTSPALCSRWIIRN